MKRLLIIALIMLFAPSCNHERLIREFVHGVQDVGLSQKGKSIFTYDPATCQMSFNREHRIFRVHTDDMSDFFTLTLARVPVEQGQEVEGTIVWTTASEVNTRRNVIFSVEKTEGDKIWLWTENGKLGAVVRILD